MLVALGILTLFISLFLHEWGHYIAMRKHGVPVECFGLGIPIRGLPFLELRIKTHRMQFHPVILGAFVKTKDSYSIETENRYRILADVAGNGVRINLITAALLYPVWAVVKFGFGSVNWTFVGMITIILLIITGYRPLFCRYLFPILSIGVAASVVIPLILWAFAPTPETAPLAGPVGIIHIATKIEAIPAVLFFWVILSSGIGLANMLPILPLDGGHYFAHFLKRKAPRLLGAYQKISIVLILGLILMVFMMDIWRLFV